MDVRGHTYIPAPEDWSGFSPTFEAREAETRVGKLLLVSMMLIVLGPAFLLLAHHFEVDLVQHILFAGTSALSLTAGVTMFALNLRRYLALTERRIVGNAPFDGFPPLIDIEALERLRAARLLSDSEFLVAVDLCHRPPRPDS